MAPGGNQGGEKEEDKNCLFCMIGSDVEANGWLLKGDRVSPTRDCYQEGQSVSIFLLKNSQHKLPESCQKVARMLTERGQKVARKLPESCKKVARKLLEN